MNNVFSVDDLSDPFWEATALSPEQSTAMAAAVPGMTRSQSEWAFQKLLEEMSASGSPMTASSETENAIGQSPPLRFQPSFTRPEEADDEDVIELQKPRDGYHIHDRRHHAQDRGNRNHALPSDPSPAASIDSDQYRAILKSKLDFACAAAVALRATSVKPEDLSASAGNQKQPAQLVSQAQGSPVAQSSPGASSASVPFLPAVQRKSDVQVRQATSGSSREDSDDDDLEGDTETTDNLGPTDVKRARRMLSNRESARRSRRRKQEQMNEFETQVGQLRVEHSSLLKRLSDMNRKYDTAAVDNRILKADIETLRTKVKMAEETVKRVTGMNPLLLARSNMPNVGLPFDNTPMGSSRIAAEPTHPNPNHILKPAVPNINTNPPNQSVGNNFPSSTLVPPSLNPLTNAGGEDMTKIPLSQHAASADHLQKQVMHSSMQTPIAPGANPCEGMPGWSHAVAKNKPQK